MRRRPLVARREQAEASRIAAEGVAEEARLGARSTLDVLNADQERLQAEAEIVRSVRDEYVAVYGLLQAMGLGEVIDNSAGYLTGLIVFLFLSALQFAVLSIGAIASD